MEDLSPDQEGKANSRKYRLALLSITLVTAVCLSTIFFPPIQSILGEFISGVLGVLGLYYTGNVFNKHVVGKQAVEIKKAEADFHGMD